MNVLGIETSCDETSVSVVRNGREILSNVVASSLNEHKRYGGIIPEIASRRQMELIHLVTQQALKKAHLRLADIDKIAVTETPGLIGSLLVGLSFARALSFALQKPLVEVDHIRAHLYANFLIPTSRKQSGPQRPDPKLPAVGLIVSGGHSSLFYMKSFTDFQLLGQTRDDAAGESFDKVARILDLGYPGGPVIDRLAQEGKNRHLQFKTADLPESFDFSFSGVKTAVLYHTKKHPSLTKQKKARVAYSFQHSLLSILIKKSLDACIQKKITCLVVGGGVAANSMLREELSSQASRCGIHVFFPPLSLCMDNAAMIAGIGYYWNKKKKGVKRAV